MKKISGAVVAPGSGDLWMTSAQVGWSSAKILHGATLQGLQPVAESCCSPYFQLLKRDVAHGKGDPQMTSA
jgi:hypothetical protein